MKKPKRESSQRRKKTVASAVAVAAALGLGLTPAWSAGGGQFDQRAGVQAGQQQYGQQQDPRWGMQQRDQQFGQQYGQPQYGQQPGYQQHGQFGQQDPRWGMQQRDQQFGQQYGQQQPMPGAQQQRDQQLGQRQYGWQQTQPGTWERRDQQLGQQQYGQQEQRDQQYTGAGVIRGDGDPHMGLTREQREQQAQHAQQQPMLQPQDQQLTQRRDQIQAAQLSSEKIREVQQKLNDKGFDQVKVDGEWGPNTQAAIRDFQKKQGIQATGQLDEQTLNQLGLDAQKFREATREARPGVAGQPQQIERR